MNLVQISNLFNQICLGINAVTPNRIGFYHYGWYSDINANISNNWTGQNELGRLYPAIQLMYPTATVEIKEKSVKGSLACRMVVSKQQYYANDSSFVNETILEAQADLEALAVSIISEYNRIARNSLQTGVLNPITIDYLSDAHNENLVLLDVRFTIWYVWNCPEYPSNLSLLNAPFSTLPPVNNDLEAQKMSYCPIGFNENVQISAGSARTYWTFLADATNFFNEITLHPNYQGGIQLVSHELLNNLNAPIDGFYDSDGIVLDITQISQTEPTATYKLIIEALFNFGDGNHLVQHELIIPITPNVTATYDSNSYTCNDLMNP